MADRERGESDQEELDRQNAEKAAAREAASERIETVTNGPERISSIEDTQRQIDAAKEKKTL